jgi:hypothetical protein
MTRTRLVSPISHVAVAAKHDAAINPVQNRYDPRGCNPGFSVAAGPIWLAGLSILASDLVSVEGVGSESGIVAIQNGDPEIGR